MWPSEIELARIIDPSLISTYSQHRSHSEETPMTIQNLFLDIAADPAGVLGLSPNISAIMADYVEAALASSSSERSRELERALVQLFHSSLKRCPDDVVWAIQGFEDAAMDTRAAYLMGQISLAQSLVSQNLSHKQCCDFERAVVHDLNLAYVRALYREDLSNKELVKIVGKVEESVSRRLKKLREWGITDSRKNGTSVINFLTPAAKKVFEEWRRSIQDEQPVVDVIDIVGTKVPAVALRLIERKSNMIPEHMKEFNALGTKRVA